MTTEKLEFEIIPALKEGEVLVVHVEVGEMNDEQIQSHLTKLESNFNKDHRYNDNQLWFVASRGNSKTMEFEIRGT
jgi:hypothetical protein